MTTIDAFHVVFRTSQGYLGSSQSNPGDPEGPWHPSSYAQYLAVGGIARAAWILFAGDKFTMQLSVQMLTGWQIYIQTLLQWRIQEVGRCPKCGCDVTYNILVSNIVVGPISPKPQPDGCVLMSFYNNNAFGKFASHMALADRNNMWLTAGYESDGTIKWSQPELVWLHPCFYIVLYVKNMPTVKSPSLICRCFTIVSGARAMDVRFSKLV